MPVLLPGTSVSVSFFGFTGQFPPLYYGPGEGSLTLASVNAGNADGLCVGLGGVNGGFLADLTAAGQKRANLSPGQGCVPGHYDDYQDRHLGLLAQAGATGIASAAYTPVDPSAFSYVDATAPVSQVPGWHEGVCFVDVFDAGLRPHGNAKNAAMLYCAPPCDVHYANANAFLSAIAATAENIIRTVAGYNAIAAQHHQPVIEALRNTLFSSNIYNQNLGVPTADIAKAILGGFAMGLRKYPASGLVELQFPAGTGSQDPLFAPLQSLLTQAAGAGPMMVLPESEDEPDEDNDNDIPMSDVRAKGGDATTIRVNGGSFTTAASRVQQATDQLLNILDGGGQLPANSQYAQLPSNPVSNYESVFSKLGGDIVYEVLPRVDPAVDLGATAAGGHARTVLTSERAVSKALRAAAQAGGDLAALKTARKVVRVEATQARRAADAAEKSANDAGNDPDVTNENLEKAAAEGARLVQKGIERASARLDERIANLQKDGQAGKSSGAKLGVIIGGILTGVGLIFTWIFVFGGGRKVVAAGVARFQIQDLTIDVDDTQTTVDIDVPTENGGLALVKAVHLHDAAGTQVDTLATNDGTWTANQPSTPTQPNNETFLHYSVKNKTSTTKAQYVLEAVGAPGAITDPANVTINFKSAPEDQFVAANDRMSVVTFTVADSFVFAGTPDSRWKYDGKKTVTFTPTAGSPVTEAILSTGYRLSADGKMATLGILFPAQPLTPTATNRSAAFTLDAPPAKVTLIANGKPVAEVDNGAAVGKWDSTPDGRIRFTPGLSLPATTMSVTVSYAYVRGTVTSKEATITLTLPGASTKPVANNLSRTTADRSKAVEWAIQNATLQGPLADPSGSGTWSVDAANGKVIFKPTLAVTASQVNVTNTYVVTEGGQASNPATLSVFFLPMPAAISFHDASRRADTTVDIAMRNAGITADYSVKLLNGAEQTDRIDSGAQGSWGVTGKTVTFSPPPTPLSSSVTVVQYVLIAPDSSATNPAFVNLYLTQSPTAYDFTVKGTNKADVLSIRFLDHCAIPAGYKDVKSTSFGVTNLPSQVTWQKTTDANGTAVIELRAASGVGSVFTLDFTVVDQNNVESAPATLTVDYSAMMRFQPMAADFLLSMQPGAGQPVVCDVLASSSSFYPTDLKSVKLIGIQDLALTGTASMALVHDDGKSMRVDGEGLWMVDDAGRIVFQADPKLGGPPTPAAWVFSDANGNVSNAGAVVIDPAVGAAAAAPSALAAMDDATFWNTYQQQVSNTVPPLDPPEFVAVTAGLAGALRTQLQKTAGPRPVSRADYEAAYQTWSNGSQVWDDPPGTAQPQGLLSVCDRLVTPALAGSTVPLAARYWRLELMARMAAKAADEFGN